MADLVAACTAFIHSPHYWEATPRQIVLLGILCDEAGPHEVRVLSWQMGVSKPVITRAANSLARWGHIERRPSGHDKRVIQLIATTYGRAMREVLRGK